MEVLRCGLERLRTAMSILRNAVSILRTAVEVLRTTMQVLRSTVERLRATVEVLRATVGVVRATVEVLRSTVSVLRSTVEVLRAAVHSRDADSERLCGRLLEAGGGCHHPWRGEGGAGPRRHEVRAGPVGAGVVRSAAELRGRGDQPHQRQTQRCPQERHLRQRQHTD